MIISVSDSSWKVVEIALHFFIYAEKDLCLLLIFYDMMLFLVDSQVQLQQKIKSESEQFRLWKASREKELLQVSIYSFHEIQYSLLDCKEIIMGTHIFGFSKN